MVETAWTSGGLCKAYESNMSETDMKVDPSRAKALVSQLQGVSERIAAVANGRSVRCLSFPSWVLGGAVACPDHDSASSEQRG
jgi:hypothetical protein